MARGGSFGGGGGRGGGFSSGGRSGGFSSGNRTPSSGSFSGSNFSSYKKSSGATPASQPTSVHTNRSSFLTGAILGSIFSGGNRNNASYNGGVSKNDVFPEVAGGNYTPKRPDPNKSGREYMHCEYCGSDYNDLNTTRCQNCGAVTTRKREEAKGSFAQETAPASATPSAKKSSSKKTVLIFFIAIVILFAVIVIFAALDGRQEEFNPVTYNWEGGNYVTYAKTASIFNWVYGSALNIRVVSAEVIGDLYSYGIEEDEYYYCVAAVELNNKSGDDYLFYISDLTLKFGGDLYVASSYSQNKARLFSERSEDGYFRLSAGGYAYFIFIYPIYNDASLSNLSLEFREFTSGGSFLNAYLLKLN